MWIILPTIGLTRPIAIIVNASIPSRDCDRRAVGSREHLDHARAAGVDQAGNAELEAALNGLGE